MLNVVSGPEWDPERMADLAAEFHGYYNAERMLVDDVALKEARIALAVAVRQVIRNGLAILGVSCPQSM